MGISLPQLISTEAGRILLPIKDLDDGAKLGRFIKALGYSYTGVLPAVDLSGMVTSVETLSSKIAALITAPTDEEKLAASFELADAVLATIEQFKAEIPKIETALTTGGSNLRGEDLGNFADVFLKRAINYLINAYLQDFMTPVYGVLYTLEIVDETVDNQSNLSYPKINWDKFGSLFSQPIELFDSAYGWSSNFDHEAFLERVTLMVSALQIPGSIYPQEDPIKTNLGRQNENNPQELRIPLYQSGTWGKNWKEIDFNISPIPASGGKKAGLLLYPYFFGTSSIDQNISENWALEVTGDAAIGSGLGIEIRPGELPQLKTQLFSSPQSGADVELSIIATYQNVDKNVLIGSTNGTYLSVAEFTVNTNAFQKGNDADFGVDLHIGQVKFVISSGDGDGFLQKVLPSDFSIEFDFGIGYSLQRGFYFMTGSGLSFALDLHKTIGPIIIQRLDIGLVPATAGLQLDLGATLQLELGPFTAIVQNMGLANNITFPDSGGNLGPIDYQIGFKPPSGIGLSVDTGVIKGGGFIEFYPDKGEYNGIFELTIKEVISVKVLGLLTTKMPDGSNNFSLLLIVLAEFTPIQLGFGFTLLGVGGLVGVNRTMELEALREGVRTGANDSILFPDDPVANAPQIIADLQNIFPVEEGRYTFGLMGKIGFGTPTLISLEVGLILEVPDPVKLAIVGVLEAILPDTELQILLLKVSFVGTIDFEQQYITFDASLFGSKLLTWTLSGDMAVRIKAGDDANFIFTVGGFHPDYTPPPLGLSNLKRLSISLLTGNNPRLTLESYFAITSNTAQFGAKVQFYYKVTGKIYVDGSMGFDALFQFSPFYFNIKFTARLGVYYKSKSYLSIKLTLTLEGPTKWHAKGRAEFKVLVFKCKVNIDKSWGKSEHKVLPNKPVYPELRAALEHPANWQPVASIGAATNVTLRALSEEEQNGLLIRPDSTIAFSQKVVPLGIRIEKFGYHQPEDFDYFDIELLDEDDNMISTETLQEQFAPDSFFKLDNAARLSRPNFEKYKSGLQFTGTANGGLTSDFFSERSVIYEQKIIDEEEGVSRASSLVTLEKLQPNLFNTWVNNGAASRSKLGQSSSMRQSFVAESVVIQQPSLVIIDALSGEVFNNLQANSVAAAQQLLEEQKHKQPHLAGQLIILNEHEMVS